MSDETTDVKKSERGKMFWVNLAFCTAVAIAVNIVWASCGMIWTNLRGYWEYRRGENYQRYEEEEEDHYSGWDEGVRNRPFDGGRKMVSRCIRENLPPESEPGMIRGIAEAFRKTAEKAESGRLRFRADSIADLNRRLQVAADRSWVPLFGKLLGIAEKLDLKTGTEIGGFLEICADELDRAAEMAVREEPEPVESLAEVNAEEKPQEEKSVSAVCGPNGCTVRR